MSVFFRRGFLLVNGVSFFGDSLVVVSLSYFVFGDSSNLEEILSWIVCLLRAEPGRLIPGASNRLTSLPTGSQFWFFFFPSL